jgi:hypothetical protein
MNVMGTAVTGAAVFGKGRILSGSGLLESGFMIGADLGNGCESIHCAIWD